MNTTGIIYSGVCVRCGAQQHRIGARIADGEVISHDTTYYDSEGLTRSNACNGAFVSLMGRTQQEIAAARATVVSQ